MEDARQRLELLAFDARLAGVPQALLESLWEAIDQLPKAAGRPHAAKYQADEMEELVGREQGSATAQRPQ